MTIRPATPDDADAIASLVNAAYEVEHFFVAGNRTSSDDVLAVMRTSRFLVTEADDGRVVACVNIAIADGRAYFGMLAVDPGSQGRGYGRALIDAVEAAGRAAGCRVMDIKVVNLREDLLRLYERLGYRASGTEPYEHRPVLRACHFITMEKPL